VTERTSPLAVASDQYVRKRHGKMFDETWKWAGTIGYGKKQRCSRSWNSREARSPVRRRPL